jgi:hypothetical protein
MESRSKVRRIFEMSALHQRCYKLCGLGTQDIHMMEVIGSLIERVQQWFARYRAELVYAEARDRRRPITEMEWNGAMIGDLKRRSLDA